MDSASPEPVNDQRRQAEEGREAAAVRERRHDHAGGDRRVDPHRSQKQGNARPRQAGDEPPALVMDRLRGSVDLSFAADDAERDRLLDEYLDVLARIYAIPLDAAARAGFAAPHDSADGGNVVQAGP